MRPRRTVRIAPTLITVGLAASVGVGTAGAAQAHSVNDLLKVPVSRSATVLLPALTLPSGPVDLQLRVAEGFSFSAVGAPAGWSSTVTARAVALQGTVAQAPVVLTLTGVASRAGALPLELWLESGSSAVTAQIHQPTGEPAYSYRITALNNYLSARDASAGEKSDSAAPDAQVALAASTKGHRSWLFPFGLVVAAVGVLTLGGGRRLSIRDGRVAIVDRR